MDIFVIIFSLFVLFLSIGIKLNKKVKNPAQNRFSILIACRNEEENLPALFDSLNKIDYPENLFELIIVDDASSDSSNEILSAYCSTKENYSNYKISIKDLEYLGKKAALKLAAKKAKYEILIFTDADCIVPEYWLKSFNNHISADVDMVTGSVLEPYAKGMHRFSGRMNSGIYASTVGLKLPFACSGGNFCLRKKRFEQVGGYSKIRNYIAGDDKLMLNMVKSSGGKISYNPEALVMTAPVHHSNKSDQKKRRFGKFKMSTIGIKLLQLAVLAFYFYLPFAIIRTGLVNLIIYYLASLAFLISTIHTHKLKLFFSDFFNVLIFPYYLIYYSIAGMLFKWKWK